MFTNEKPGKENTMEEEGEEKGKLTRRTSGCKDCSSKGGEMEGGVGGSFAKGVKTEGGRKQNNDRRSTHLREVESEKLRNGGGGKAVRGAYGVFDGDWG